MMLFVYLLLMCLLAPLFGENEKNIFFISLSITSLSSMCVVHSYTYTLCCWRPDKHISSPDSILSSWPIENSFTPANRSATTTVSVGSRWSSAVETLSSFSLCLSRTSLSCLALSICCLESSVCWVCASRAPHTPHIYTSWAWERWMSVNEAEEGRRRRRRIMLCIYIFFLLAVSSSSVGMVFTFN